MRQTFRWLCPLILVCVPSVFAAEPPPLTAKPGIENCTVATPEGEFAQVAIEFDSPLPWTLHAALRGGRIRVDDQVGVLEPGGWIDVKDGKVSGSFRRFLKTKTGTQPFAFTVEGTMRDGVIAGTCKVTTGGAKSAPVGGGAFSGRVISEAELKKSNALAPSALWDSFLGSAGAAGSAVPPGGPVVDGFDRARFLWRSEEPVPQGLAPLTRFMNTWGHASTIRTGGGSFSPVLGEGKIFCYYRFPVPGALGKKRDTPINYEEDAKKAGFDRVPEYVQEKGYEKANEVVMAMDATTGKTLWRATVALGVTNHQGHKERNSDRTPAYADGKLFVVGRAGWIYAFDAATGKPLWQAPGVGEDGAYGIVATKDVVVVPTGISYDSHWTGLDPQTGKTLWRMPDATRTWSPSRWVHDGKTYIVAVVADQPLSKEKQVRLVCVEPRTGSEVWSMPFEETSRPGPSIFRDWLLVYCTAPTKAAGGKDDDAMPMGSLGLKAFHLSLKGPELRWQYPNVGHHYSIPVVLMDKYVFACGTVDLKPTLKPTAVLELATGKPTDVQKYPDNFLPANGGFMEAIGNLAVSRFDGTHGGIQFHVYAVSPEGKIVRDSDWQPPQYGGQTHTTSYHHPIMYPYADGRVWVRQYDGIYCYELRKTAGMMRVDEALDGGKLTGGAALDALLPLLTDADAGVRAETLRVLRARLAADKPGDRAPRLLKRLGELWSDTDRSVRLAAAAATAALGTAGADLLLAKAADKDLELRAVAVEALGQLKGVESPRIAESLAENLTAETDRRIVLAALTAARSRGEPASKLIDAIVPWVDSSDDSIRLPAALTLVMISPEGQPPARQPKRLIKSLIEIMSEPEVAPAAKATAMIRGFGEQEALRIFSDILKADNPLAGIRACNGLGAMGAPGKAAIPQIQEAKVKWAGFRTFVGTANSALAKLEGSR